jgi:biopolymer transport protein TolQ
MLQGGAVPRTALELVLISSIETRVVLVITAVLSLAAWFVIILKWLQFRRVHRQGQRFFAEIEKTTRLQDAYAAVGKLSPSPFGRVMREAVNFYAELRPGALKEEAQRRPLSPVQLEALKLVLGKEVSAERDMLSHYIPWLAIVGAVGPLIGLLGTVLGVMDAFIGIAAKGSGNIGAVAPGVAEALVTTVAGPRRRDSRGDLLQHLREPVRLIASELEGFASEVIGTMAREGLI